MALENEQQQETAQSVPQVSDKAPDEAAPATDTLPDDDDGLLTLYRKLTEDEDDGESSDEAPKDEVATEDEKSSEEKEKSDANPKAADGEPEEAIAKPRAWASEMDDAWKTLPRDVQEYVTKREADLHRRLSKLGGQAKKAEPISHVLRSYEHVIPEGVSAADAVERLMKAQALLSENPVAGLTKIAATVGVDLRQLADFLQNGDANLAVENAALKAEQRHAHYAEQAQAAAADEESREELMSTIAEWQAGKEHYDLVEQDMAAIIGTIPDKSDLTPTELLDKAYEKACRVNDAVQQRIASAQAASQEQARSAEREARERKRAEDAARSQRLNAGAVPDFSGEVPEVFDIDDDDHMKSLYRRAAQR